MRNFIVIFLILQVTTARPENDEGIIRVKKLDENDYRPVNQNNGAAQEQTKQGNAKVGDISNTASSDNVDVVIAPPSTKSARSQNLNFKLNMSTQLLNLTVETNFSDKDVETHEKSGEDTKHRISFQPLMPNATLLQNEQNNSSVDDRIGSAAITSLAGPGYPDRPKGQKKSRG